MKKLLGGVAALALFAASPALADAHKMMEPAPGWNGIFLSAALGAGAIVHELSSPLLPGASFNGIGGEGIFGAISVGFDRQLHPNIVAGMFFDYEFSGVSTDLSAPGLISASIDQDRTMWLGVRLGYLTTPTTLWYGMAGWTRTSLDLSSSIGNLDLGDYSGFFLGGGVESQLGRGWSIKAEYRYADYGSKNVLGLVDIEPSTHTARVGISYRFGRDHEPAAQPMK